MDALGQSELVDAGLKTTFQEILHLESEHVIELHPPLIEHANTDQTTNQGITLKQPLRVFLVQGQELTSENRLE